MPRTSDKSNYVIIGGVVFSVIFSLGTALYNRGQSDEKTRYLEATVEAYHTAAMTLQQNSESRLNRLEASRDVTVSQYGDIQRRLERIENNQLTLNGRR